MSNLLAIVTADLILLAIAIARFVPDVVATVAALLRLLAVTGQMTDAIAFVAFLT